MKKNAFGPRRAFLFFVVVCLLAAAAGCGADGQPGGEDELPELVIASDSYEPYHYIEANGDHAGIDVELAREACSRLGYRPVFLDIAWEDKDSDLEKGLADCLWGCFTMTGREQDYQWAGPYLVSRQTVLVRAVVRRGGEENLTLIQIERRARTSRTVRRCRLECTITGDRSKESVTLRGSG